MIAVGTHTYPRGNRVRLWLLQNSARNLINSTFGGHHLGIAIPCDPSTEALPDSRVRTTIRFFSSIGENRVDAIRFAPTSTHSSACSSPLQEIVFLDIIQLCSLETYCDFREGQSSRSSAEFSSLAEKYRRRTCNETGLQIALSRSQDTLPRNAIHQRA